MRRALELLLLFYSGYKREGEKLQFKINNFPVILGLNFYPYHFNYILENNV